MKRRIRLRVWTLMALVAATAFSLALWRWHTWMSQRSSQYAVLARGADEGAAFWREHARLWNETAERLEAEAAVDSADDSEWLLGRAQRFRERFRIALRDAARYVALANEYRRAVTFPWLDVKPWRHGQTYSNAR